MMKTITYLLFALGLLVACQIPKEQKETVKDLNKNGLMIDSEILASIQKEIGKDCEPLNREIWKYYEDGTDEHYFLDTGVIFKFIDESTAHQVFMNYHKKVQNSGNYLFLTHLDFDESFNSHYDLVIINESDPFQVISLMGTSGVNYDLYTQDIVSTLKKWNSQVGFTFEVIDESRIHAYMDHLPKDIPQFTEEVYAFCPDVIDQGYGSMEEMITDYKTHKYFWLWWD